MSRFTDQQRQAFRKPRAAEAARARKAADPYEQFQARVEAAEVRPSIRLVANALVKRHHELGRGIAKQPIMVGYGGRPRTERQGEQEAAYKPLAEATGLHRRTVQRAIADLVGMGLGFFKLPGGPKEDRYQDLEVPSRKERVVDDDGRVRYRAIGVYMVHTIGRGGCKKGGHGLANAYWVDGCEAPPADPTPSPADPTPEPEPPSSGAGPSGWQRAMKAAERKWSGSSRAPPEEP